MGQAQHPTSPRTPGSGPEPATPRGNLVTATTEQVQEQVHTSAHVSHEHSRLARATLAVMALGMGWMLLSMQFGSDMAGMTGMTGSGHHH